MTGEMDGGGMVGVSWIGQMSHGESCTPKLFVSICVYS